MATPTSTPKLGETIRRRIFGSTRIVILLVLSLLLVACLVFSWTTRDAMGSLSFIGRGGRSGKSAGGKKTIVDLSPWQTAQALAPLAVTAEEKEFARNAERLADHEVDQAFASSLRQATLQAQHITLKGEALALSQKVAQLQQIIRQDQAQVESITAQLNAPSSHKEQGTIASVDSGDLEVAKAQLGLDEDELADANQDLDRATGDQTAQVQAELNAHEASMRQYDKRVQSGGDVAVVAAKRRGTMAARVQAWFDQRDRYQLLQQAVQQTKDDIQELTAAHNGLETKLNTAQSMQPGVVADHSAKLAEIKDRSSSNQILSIYDDRIQTNQQLALVYSRWSSQVQLQHRIVLHMILSSLALIMFIGICMVLLDALVRRLMAYRAIDRRRSQTLRSIFQLSIQVAGGILILLVIFGIPRETPTILGLATAALTIALQDFIIAFLGWFVLVGKNGIHVGDWVEINGVGGEVTEVRLFSTTLLETGTLADKGLPTGRRITFMNGFAIRGKYFNFSTTGQWMWDEITISLPANADIHKIVDSIHSAVIEETEHNVHVAEQEWKRGTNAAGLSSFSATPIEILLPSGPGIDLQVRYVTRASERFDLRSRLYQKIVGILRDARAVESGPGRSGEPEDPKSR
jgi:small-conductance mechanosensitive channel